MSAATGGHGLPAGATVNADGSIMLRLSAPIDPPRCGANQGIQPPYMVLKFRRLTGALCAKIRRARKPVNASLTHCLGVSLAAAAQIQEHTSPDDLMAIFQVVASLMPRAEGIPSRCEPLPDGGFLLPLLYPVSDGAASHASLRLRPLTLIQANAVLSCTPEKDVGFGIHYASAIPLRNARFIADVMDGVDYQGAQAILVRLIQETHPVLRRALSAGAES